MNPDQPPETRPRQKRLEFSVLEPTSIEAGNDLCSLRLMIQDLLLPE